MCALSYRYGFEDDLTADRAALARGGDWDVPLFCRDDCYDTSAEARHVFPQNTFFIVGGARTGTNLHVDPNCTSAWNALLCGRKRWALFPPVDAEGRAAMGVIDDSARVKRTPPCVWWQDVYPRYSCVQRPDESVTTRQQRAVVCVLDVVCVRQDFGRRHCGQVRHDRVHPRARRHYLRAGRLVAHRSVPLACTFAEPGCARAPGARDECV